MSAVPVPISAVDPMAEAIQQYLAAKREKDAVQKRLLDAEQRILALHPALEEGAETFEAAGFKVTVTGKLGYACSDPRALAEACAAAGMPGSWAPVKTKVELDETGAKWLRANEPELWARVVSQYVTVKPAKTSVTVKV